MKFLLLAFSLFMLQTTIFSQNVGIGTTSPTNTLHVIVSPTNPNPNPVRFEGIQRYTTEDSVLVVNPSTGEVKYMPMADVLANIPPNVLDSLILNSVINNTDTIYNNQSVRDSIIAIALGNSDTLFSTQIFRDSVLGAILSNMDTIFTITRDSLLNDSTFINTLRDSIDTDIDSVTFANDTIYIYENGTVVQTYINTSLDTALVDSLIFAKSDSLYTFISDSLTKDTTWIKQLDSLLSIYGDTIYFNDSTYTLIKDSLLNDTAWLSELQDSINTDDQNIDSLTLTGTILTTYIENGTSASIDVSNMLDSVILSKSDTLYSIISDSLTKDTNWIKQIDSLLSIYGDTIYFNDTSYTLISDSLLNDTLWIDSLGKLLNDNDWNINSNGTGLEAAPAGNNYANGAYAIAAGQSDTALGAYSVVAGGNNNVAFGPTTTVSGGWLNKAIGWTTVVSGGRENIAIGTFSVIGGGRNDSAIGHLSTISGGYNNIASGDNSVISGGGNNRALASSSAIGGGIENVTTGNYSVIAGGYRDTAQGYASGVLSGYQNKSTGSYSSITGGYQNKTGGSYSTVGGYRSYVENSNYSISIGYLDSIFGAGTYSTLIGGEDNKISSVTGRANTIIGGLTNEMIESGSYLRGASMFGGIGNKIISTATLGFDRESTIIGGALDTIMDAHQGVIVGGLDNKLEASVRAGIFAGRENKLLASHRATMLGGYVNQINSGSIGSSLIGGDSNIINNSSHLAVIIGGRKNTANNFAQTVLGHYSTNSVPVGSSASTVASDNIILKVGNGTDASNLNDAMVVKANGNVGVNTSNPTARLHVVDTTKTGGNDAEILLIGGRNSLNAFKTYSLDSNNGFFGISLGIVGSQQTLYPGYGDPEETYIYSSNRARGLNIITNSAKDNHISFFNGGANGPTTMYLSPSRQVGIGTSSPTNKLHINDTDPLKLEGLQYGGTTDSVLVTDANGVVKLASASSIASTKSFVSTSTSYTFANNIDVVLADLSASAFTVTLPNPTTNSGRVVKVKRVDDGTSTFGLSFASPSGTIDGVASPAGPFTVGYQGYEFMSDGTNWWILTRY